MKRSIAASSPFAIVLLLAACSGSGNGPTPPIDDFGGDFLVLKTEPLNNGQLFLNDPVRIDFSRDVDLRSADLGTFAFQVLDQRGRPVAEQPTGNFALDRSPGDEAVGRRLLFVPRFPTNDTFDNGGFRPGRTYLVQLVAGDRHNGTVLRARNGRALDVPTSFSFRTADGSTPSQLFRDRVQGGPRRTRLDITPAPVAGVVLNKFGSPPVEIRVTFDQAVNPHSANVPVALDTNPLVRNSNDRGRIFLEYDDPEFGLHVWIPADVELEQNDLERAVVLLRPVGVLPNNATISVLVERTFEDISGESNVANAAYDRVVATFRTQAAFEPQFDALVEAFVDSALLDLAAPQVEPFADVEHGFLKAGFEFEGTRTELEYEPTAPEVVLNTNFAQVVPKNGPAFNVSDGVFNFKNVTIPNGVIVKGVGTRPMVWLCQNDFIVAGTLSVSGGDGERVNGLNSANVPVGGGIGVCGGGSGGTGSPSASARDMTGAAGFGANQAVGGGGLPGQLACQQGCVSGDLGAGSGGGGGSLATQGDPFYKTQAGGGTAFQQQRGNGGQGCFGTSGATSRSLNGGDPGPVVFRDARSDNNFLGVGIDRHRQLRIHGELAAPLGGEGGGAGGDRSRADGCSATSNFINDNRGGGGGGGAGVLIVKALRDIKITSTGFIRADGGHGGGGEPAGSSQNGGGGGGGAGGLVVLMAGRRIEIVVKGSVAQNRFRYASPDNEFTFSVSADGGVTKTGTFGVPVAGKYPPLAAGSYDSVPLGGFGGMGLIQLMTPPGNNSDGTNTILDDGIDVLVPTNTGNRQATALEKKQLLAWRGFADNNGVAVDDQGLPTAIGANEGDLRPTPVLLPVPFSDRTRITSQWIDTGASVRRPVPSADGQPRGIVEAGDLRAGPTFEFAGVQRDNGFIAFDQTGGNSVRVAQPAVLTTPAEVLSAAPGAPRLGAPTYRVELVQPQPELAPENRFSHFEAELLSAGNTVLGSYRILAHTDRVLQLAAESPLATDAVLLQVRKKFFKVVTDGQEGLGPTYQAGSARSPIANVRIGFAFHQDPTAALTSGDDPRRFPRAVGTFAFDLDDPQVIEQLRLLHARFLQWDVLFDTTFAAVPGDELLVPKFGPGSPRPELHFLRLPFHF